MANALLDVPRSARRGDVITLKALVSHMMENPATISTAAHLLFIARNLERIGDHATNVAEMVYYAATGRYFTDRSGAVRLEDEE